MEGYRIQVQCKVSAGCDDLRCHQVSSADVGSGWSPVFLSKSKVNTAIYQNILELFTVPPAEKLYADFLFQQDIASSHRVTRYIIVLILVLK